MRRVAHGTELASRKGGQEIGRSKASWGAQGASQPRPKLQGGLVIARQARGRPVAPGPGPARLSIGAWLDRGASRL